MKIRIVVAAVMAVAAATGGARAQSATGYERTIVLSVPTPAPDFQVRVDLTPATFDYTRVLPGGADLRFLDSTAITSFSYWIETWSSTGTSTIWVKVPTAGTSSLLMRYGTDATAPASDGTSTFLFFDDFTALTGWTVLRTGGWNGESLIGIEDGFSTVKIGDDANSLDGLWHKPLAVTDEIVLEARMKMTSRSPMFGFYSPTTANNPRFILDCDGAGLDAWTDGASQYGWSYLAGTPAPLGSWVRIRVAKSGTSIAINRSYAAGTETRSMSSGAVASITSVMMGYQTFGTGEAHVDFFFVRRRAAVEPVSTMGTESPLGPPAPPISPAPPPGPPPPTTEVGGSDKKAGAGDGMKVCGFGASGVTGGGLALLVVMAATAALLSRRSA